MHFHLRIENQTSHDQQFGFEPMGGVIGLEQGKTIDVYFDLQYCDEDEVLADIYFYGLSNKYSLFTLWSAGEVNIGQGGVGHPPEYDFRIPDVDKTRRKRGKIELNYEWQRETTFFVGDEKLRKMQERDIAFMEYRAEPVTLRFVEDPESGPAVHLLPGDGALKIFPRNSPAWDATSRTSAARLYDVRTREITRDLPAILKLVGNSKSVLEVGAGTGRVAACLAEGAPSLQRYLGVDLDRVGLNLARTKVAGDDRFIFKTKDFVKVRCKEKFDVILFPLNVIAEFLTPDDRIRALKRARNLLAKRGRIILTLDAPDFADWAEPMQSHQRKLHDDELGDWRVIITCHRNHTKQTSRCKVLYEPDDPEMGSVWTEYATSLVTRNELIATYAAVGLNLKQEYGSYDLEQIKPWSSVYLHELDLDEWWHDLEKDKPNWTFHSPYNRIDYVDGEIANEEHAEDEDEVS